MTWNQAANQGNEVAKTRWRATPYLRGKGIDMGCGPNQLYETKNVIKVDSNKDLGLFGIPANFDIQADITDMSLFASRSVDWVFSSHALEHVEWAKVPETLRGWCRLVKKGGHVVLYLPASGLYPDPGAIGANPDHKWPVTYDAVIEAMETVPRDWDLVEFQRCDESDEYSFFFAFKLTGE